MKHSTLMALFAAMLLAAVLMAFTDASPLNVEQTLKRRELYRRYAAYKVEFDKDHGEAGSDSDIAAFENFEASDAYIQSFHAELARNDTSADRRREAQCGAAPGLNSMASEPVDWFLNFLRGLSDGDCPIAIDPSLFVHRSSENDDGSSMGLDESLAEDGEQKQEQGERQYGYSSNGYSSNGYSSNGYSSNGYSSNGYSSNGYSSNGYSSYGTPSTSPSPSHFPSPSPLPVPIDWRSRVVNGQTKSYVSDVSDQGRGNISCAACWAFSVTNTLESLYAIAGEYDIWQGTGIKKLAHSQLTGCSKVWTGFEQCTSKSGMPTWAISYMINMGGTLATQAAFPSYISYLQNQNNNNPGYGQSQTSYTASQYAVCNALMTSTTSHQLTGFDAQNYVCGYRVIGNANEYAIYTHLVPGLTTNQPNGGPVIAMIDHRPDSFRLYTGSGVGTYSDTTASKTTLTHAVVIVGLGIDSCSDRYWIVKNSWGVGWGKAGYVHMKYNINQSGIGTFAVVVKLAPRLGTNADGTNIRPKSCF